MIRWKLIKDTAGQLLNQLSITEPPVNIEAVARQQGILLTSAAEKDDVSGFLLREPGCPAVIGVNSNHHPWRQRFTIAHELGHLLLHGRTELHVDRLVVKLQDRRARGGNNEDEMEANRFAAEILMPEEFLRADLKNLGSVSVDNEQVIEDLSRRYEVSKQAMTIRLTSLDLIWM
ncbi:MAG: ImmA/IrrE family metallo-endopeptidase [Verrucomicrobiae bacterium]|nr:ImmA/IrrE family metallo-endopeptidase [Verrucomicrobiae bacterium]